MTIEKRLEDLGEPPESIRWLKEHQDVLDKLPVPIAPDVPNPINQRDEE